MTRTTTTTRLTYAERWPTLDPDTKARVAGDALSAIEEFHARLPEVSWDDRERLRLATWPQLEALRTRIDGVEAHRARLYAQQRQLIVWLLMAGEKQSRIARALGMTDTAISLQVGGPFSERKRPRRAAKKAKPATSTPATASEA